MLQASSGTFSGRRSTPESHVFSFVGLLLAIALFVSYSFLHYANSTGGAIGQPAPSSATSGQGSKAGSGRAGPNSWTVATMPAELASGKLTYDEVYRGIESTVTEQHSCVGGSLLSRGKYCFTWLKEGAGNPETFKGGIERTIALRIAAILDALSPANAVFFDIGMNAGYFTLLAATRGVEVHAFDPQPACVALVTRALALNAQQHRRRRLGRVSVHNVALAAAPVPQALQLAALHRPGDREVSSDGTAAMHGGFSAHLDVCHGGFSISPLRKEQPRTTHVDMVPLRRYLAALGRDRPVTVMKMDIEANEIGVLASVMPAFEAGRIQHLIVETKPGSWHSKDVLPSHGRELLARLAELAKAVTHLESGRKMETPAAVTDGACNCNLYFRFV